MIKIQSYFQPRQKHSIRNLLNWNRLDSEKQLFNLSQLCTLHFAVSLEYFTTIQIFRYNSTIHFLFVHNKIKSDCFTFFNFSNCTDIQRMFHILSMKAMTKAFKKAEEIVQNSLKSCQSDDAWNEIKKKPFNKCTAQLKESSNWIDQFYPMVEKVAADEGRYIIFSDNIKMRSVLVNVHRTSFPLFLKLN